MDFIRYLQKLFRHLRLSELIRYLYDSPTGETIPPLVSPIIDLREVKRNHQWFEN